MKINSTKDKVLYKLYQLINNYRAKKIISNYNEKHYLNIVKLLDDFQNVSHFKKLFSLGFVGLCIVIEYSDSIYTWY